MNPARVISAIAATATRLSCAAVVGGCGSSGYRVALESPHTQRTTPDRLSSPIYRIDVILSCVSAAGHGLRLLRVHLSEELPAMLAHVTMFEGATADSIRGAADRARNQIAGPPPGIHGSKGVTILVDPDGGSAMMIALFDTQEDLRASLSAIEETSPPNAMGRRATVGVFEVAAEVRR